MRKGKSGSSLRLLILLNGGEGGPVKAQLNDLRWKFFSFNFHFASSFIKRVKEEVADKRHKDVSVIKTIIKADPSIICLVFSTVVLPGLLSRCAIQPAIEQSTPIPAFCFPEVAAYCSLLITSTDALTVFILCFSSEPIGH